MKVPVDKNIYRILLQEGSLSQEVLDSALKDAEEKSKPFIYSLLSSGVIDEKALLNIFSKVSGAPVINLNTEIPDPSIFERVPVKFASYYKFFPIRQDNGKIIIAVSKPLDIHTLDEMRFALGADVGMCFAPEKDIEEALQKHYGLAANTVEKILSETAGEEKTRTPSVITQEVEDLEKLAAAPSVAQVVNEIILDAYKKRASDIHLEPLAFGIRLRYRVDGILHEAAVPKELKEFFSPMLSRIKIMANLNVAEKRLPQDGKLRVKTQDETIDLRVSFIPTAHGESVVIRILPGKNIFTLEQLGFDAGARRDLEDLLSKPNGVLFVTGPTGSGKSTTLYAALNKLNSSKRKIITIEDPVEYEIEGVNQIHVNPEIGLTFSAGLRSILRQDPDILMVGEVRDLETADIAIRAALTGHLLLSTLHTNDAASGVTRLLDIGVEPYLIASSVIAFVAQRLVRLNCPHCKKEDTTISSDVKKLVETEYGIPHEEIKIFRGAGCEKCSGTGFLGRVAINEILKVTEPIRKLIMERTTAEEIKETAVRAGMKTLRVSGWAKVLEGQTTPEEVLEATEEDAQEIYKITDIQNVETQQKLPETKTASDLISNENKNNEIKPSASVFTQITKEKIKYTNLRKFQRVECEIPVRFSILEYKGLDKTIQAANDELAKIEFEGNAKNISAGGVYFYAQDRDATTISSSIERMTVKLSQILESDNILDIKIMLPNADQPIHCQCVARVLRVSQGAEESENGGKIFCRVGASFLTIDSEDRYKLIKFCEAKKDKKA